MSIKRPMAISAFLCAAVALTGAYLPSLLICAGATLILSFFILLFFRNATGCVSVALALVAVFSILTLQSGIAVNQQYDGQVFCGDFTVLTQPVSRSGYMTCELKPLGKDCKCITGKLFAVFSGKCLSAGDVITAKCKLRSLSDSEYRFSNYADGIFMNASVESIDKVRHGGKFLKLCTAIRNYTSLTLFSLLPQDEAATLNAVTTGDLSRLSSSFYETVKASGVSHVLVVSGLHLSIIMGAVFSLINRFMFNRLLRFGMALLIVFLMAGICEFSMSILRAGIVYIIMSFSHLLWRESDGLNSLGAAVTLILLFSPFAILSISFQLTVLSTYGILVLSPFLKAVLINRLCLKSRFTKALTSAVSISVSATVMTMPVIAGTFGSISTVSVPANLFIGIPVSAALVFSALGLLLCAAVPFLPFGRMCLFAAGLTAKYVNSVIDFFGSLPFASVTVPTWISTIFWLIAAILPLLVTVYRKNAGLIKRYSQIPQQKIKRTQP